MTVLARPSARRVASLFAPLLGLALFALLAGYRWDQPGPYYDEALFVPPALRLATGCGLEAGVVVEVACVPIVLSPAYLGGLKAIVHAPVFALFGTNLATLRVPSLLVAALGLLFACALVRRVAGPVWAAVAGVLLAIDPAFVAHVRMDWGPVAFGLTLKLGLMLSLWRWLERPEGRWLWVALACTALGLWDKLTFAWVVVGLAPATAFVFGARALRHVRSMSAAQRVGATLCLLAIAAGSLAMYALAIDAHPGAQAGWSYRFARIWALYAATFGSDTVAGWMHATDVPYDYRWGYVLVAQLVAGLAIAVAHRGEPPGRASFVAWLTVALPVVLLAMAATPQVGGTHHLMSVWPLPMLQLVALAAWLSERTSRKGLAARTTIAVVVTSAIALLLASHAARDLRELARRDAEQRQWHPVFDPAIAGMAAAIAARDPDLVVSADWGINNSLFVLLPEPMHVRLHDWFPGLDKDPLRAPDEVRWLYDVHLRDRVATFVAHAEVASQIPGPRVRLPQFIAQWRGCVIARERIPGSAGQPLFELTTVGFGKHCVAARGKRIAGSEGRS